MADDTLYEVEGRCIAKTDLSVEYVRRLFDYDKSTGDLIWRRRQDRAANWNSSFAGKVAGSARRGYIKIILNKKLYFAHRLVWLHQYGVWPANQIDHINGVRNDNRLENLRDVSNLENGRNQRRHSDNKSGAAGVGPMRGKWRAYINLHRKQKHLGMFDTKEEAIALDTAVYPRGDL